MSIPLPFDFIILLETYLYAILDATKSVWFDTSEFYSLVTSSQERQASSNMVF